MVVDYVDRHRGGGGGGGGGGWGQKYWERYVSEAHRLGVTPDLDRIAFIQKLNTNNYEGSYQGVYSTELVPKAVERINRSRQNIYNWDPSKTYTPYDGSTSFEELLVSVNSQLSIEKVTKPKNIKDDGTIDPTIDATGKKKYIFTPNEIMKQLEEQTQIDAGYMKNPAYTKDGEESEWIKDPNFVDAVRPEYSYDPTDTGKYFDTISQAEQAGTNKAVSAVNEVANATNPYTTGSGNQIKAVSGMLDSITASQQARAFALGENVNQQKYSGRVADYDIARNKKTGALQNLSAIGQYYDKMSKEADDKNETNYWDHLKIDLAINSARLRGETDDRKYERDMRLLERSAELNKPQQADWWQGWVAPAIGAFTGGVGGAAASALMGNTTSNYFKNMDKYLYRGGSSSPSTAGAVPAGYKLVPI